LPWTLALVHRKALSNLTGHWKFKGEYCIYLMFDKNHQELKELDKEFVL
jgi:hypothetical protein